MCENYDCSKFHDVILTLILDAAFTLLSKQVHSSYIKVLLMGKRSMIFGQLVNVKFHAGTMNSLDNFNGKAIRTGFKV